MSRDVYSMTPAVGLRGVYDKVSKGDKIEIKSKVGKWKIATVVDKYINDVWGLKIYNITVTCDRKEYELRDEHDFHWRYDELYEENKYLLRGYWNKTREVRMVEND